MKGRKIYSKQKLILGISILLAAGTSAEASSPGFGETSFNSMVDSEMFFNPTVNGDFDLAEAYLNDKLGMSSVLSLEQAYGLYFSKKLAQQVDPDHPFKATAAVIDKIVMTNDEDYFVTVTTDEIADQRFVKNDIQFDTIKLSWEEPCPDEDPQEMVTLNGRDLTVIATSDYNTLVVIDYSDEDHPQITSQKYFAGVEGPEHTIDSVTGASEHSLHGIKAAPDGGTVYISVVPRRGDESVGNEHDDRYGLFRVVVEDSGVTRDHDDPSTKRYDNANIGSYDVLADGRVFVEDTKDDVIRILTADLVDTGDTLALPAGIDARETFYTSNDTVYVATGGDNDATPPIMPQLHKVIDGVSTASMDLEMVPSGMVLFDDDNQALIYQRNFFAAIIDLTTMEETRRLPLDEMVRQSVWTATVTADGHYAILAGREKAEVWVYDLTLPESRMEKVAQTETVIRAFATDANGKIFAGGRTGFCYVSNLEVGDVLTPEESIAGDKTYITGESINYGLPLSLVIADLSLYTEVPAASNGSSISWSTTTSSINMIPTEENPLGAVTRPEGSDDSGQLTATLNYEFRDISVSDSITGDVTVRKAPALLPDAKVVQTDNNSSQYMAANVDGDMMVAPMRFENADGESVYGFNAFLLDDTGQPGITTGTADTPVTYSGTESIVAVGLNGSNVIGVSAALDDTGQARIFTVAIGADGVMADTVNAGALNITTGAPLKAGFSADQSKVGVMIKMEDESYITEIYSVAADGALSLDSTITMKADTEYKTYGPPAINDAGTVVYQRDGDNVIMSTADNPDVATVAVDEVARVWFYNNRVFVNTYVGTIMSFDDTLGDPKEFNTGTGGRMYGAAGRSFNGKNYLYIPLQRASDSANNGIYQLEILADGSLEEVAFSPREEGADRMTVSGDGDTVFYSYRVRGGDDDGRWMAAIQIPTP